jgi:hypothetical protein
MIGGEKWYLQREYSSSKSSILKGNSVTVKHEGGCKLTFTLHSTEM